MAVYVDAEMIEWRGRRWCHLVADSLSELHAFAKRMGLRREWFQGQRKHPHYDVTDTMRDKAIALGANKGDRMTIIRCTKQLRAELLAEKPEPVQTAFAL